MSMKGFFNPKQTNQHLQTELADFKHQIKRINTLEVHMNRFLKLEPQMGSLIMFKKSWRLSQCFPTILHLHKEMLTKTLNNHIQKTCKRLLGSFIFKRKSSAIGTNHLHAKPSR